MAFINQELIPDFVSAPTPESLKQKIRHLQYSRKEQYNFISFYQDQKTGRHIAWYYKRNDGADDIKEILNGTSEKSKTASEV